MKPHEKKGCQQVCTTPTFISFDGEWKTRIHLPSLVKGGHLASPLFVLFYAAPCSASALSLSRPSGSPSIPKLAGVKGGDSTFPKWREIQIDQRSVRRGLKSNETITEERRNEAAEGARTAAAPPVVHGFTSEPEGKTLLKRHCIYTKYSGGVVEGIYRGSSYLLGQRFSTCFVLKFALQKVVRNKRDGVHFSKQSTQTL